MKVIITTIFIGLLISACVHREYYNVYKQEIHNLETDKAKCTYLAENRVSLVRPVVNIIIRTKVSKKEHKHLEVQKKQIQQQQEWKRDRKVRKLRDLCLKAKGWRWRYIE